MSRKNILHLSLRTAAAQGCQGARQMGQPEASARAAKEGAFRQETGGTHRPGANSIRVRCLITYK